MMTRKSLTISCVDLMLMSLYISIIINFADVLSLTVNKFWLLVSLALGYGGIAMYYIGRFASREHKATGWKLSDTWMLIVIYMITVGIFNLSFGNGRFDKGVFLNQDMRFVMHYAIGIIFAQENWHDKYKDLMGKFCIVAVILTFVGFATYDFSQAVSARTEVWTLAYYCWWQISTCFLFAYSYIKFGKRKKTRYIIVVAAFIIFALLFLKRISIIEFLLIALICGCVEIKSSGKKIIAGKVMQKLFIITVVAITVLLGIRAISSISPYFAELIDVYTKRFSEIGKTEFNPKTGGRLEEVFDYFQTAEIGRIIFGQGIYSYAPSLISTGSEVLNAFHIGLPNIIYKGGVIYLIFVIYLAIKVFKKFKYCSQMTQFEKMCLSIALFSIFRIFFAGSWTYSNDPIGYITPLFVIVTMDIKPQSV